MRCLAKMVHRYSIKLSAISLRTVLETPQHPIPLRAQRYQQRLFQNSWWLFVGASFVRSVGHLQHRINVVNNVRVWSSVSCDNHKLFQGADVPSELLRAMWSIGGDRLQYLKSHSWRWMFWFCLSSFQRLGRTRVTVNPMECRVMKNFASERFAAYCSSRSCEEAIVGLWYLCRALTYLKGVWLWTGEPWD